MAVTTEYRILTESGWKTRGAGTIGGGDEEPGRDDLVIGTYKPDASNTGVLPDISRTNYNSPSTSGTLTVSPGTYQNLDFWGDIQLTGAGTWTFSNCFFHGGIGHPGNNRGCLYCWSMTGSATFTDCTFSAQDPSYYRDGIVGRGYTLTRCEIYNTNDGAGAFHTSGGAANVTIQGCYIHDLVWWRQDPAHSDGTHNDGVQIQGGSGFTIIGNHIHGYKTADPESTEPIGNAPHGNYIGSGIIINQNTGASTGVTISQNWIYGCYAQLQLNRGSSYNPLTATLGPNRYGRDVYENYPANSDKRWICLVPNGGTIDATGLLTDQRFDDNDALLVPGRATGIRTV